MNIINVMVAAIISMVILFGTMQGIAVAFKSQKLIAKKSAFVLEVQGIGNVLTDPSSCDLSEGYQYVAYANHEIAYSAGDGIIDSFVWSTQGNTTVLTINPTDANLKPVVLNCTQVNSNTDHFKDDGCNPGCDGDNKGHECAH